MKRIFQRVRGKDQIAAPIDNGRHLEQTEARANLTKLKCLRHMAENCSDSMASAIPEPRRLLTLHDVARKLVVYSEPATGPANCGIFKG